MVENRAKEFMTKDAIEDFRNETSKQSKREKHGGIGGAVDTEHERKVNEFISQHRTWREGYPVLRTFEYWRLRADYYPYIRQSDQFDDFFLRGITCHPRLSDYPMCKNVIRDYFICRDSNRLYQLANVCSPLKEQMSSCINVVFVKNHKKGDKKFNDKREEYFEAQREKKVNKLLEHVATTQVQKQKFAD